MKKTNLKYPALSIAMAVASALATPAVAQQGANGADDLALEEIVVTARKREETIQEAPLSIQAFTSDQLGQRGISNFADLASSVPV